MSDRNDITHRRLRLGADLGGSTIEIIALASGEQNVRRWRVATPTGDDAGALTTIVGSGVIVCGRGSTRCFPSAR